MMLSVAATKQRGAFTLNVRFELPMPGVLALFGRSGCGKSTVVNIISGLLEPEAGSVVLNDTVLLDTQRGIDVPPERRRIGYVFQDARLFPHLRVSANLRYAQKRAAGASYVSLDTVVALLDLRSLMDRRTHQLSGGERQRVAIGRALLAQPRLLLLDEPLASLDSARREEVLPYLETLRDQLALPMVYVTHDFSDVLRLATHLVFMESGSVVAQGAVAEMSLNPHLRRLIGPDEVGAIIDGVALGTDSHTQLMKIRVGHGELNLQVEDLAPGTALRIQLLARDVIVSTRAPEYLSVRNSLAGTVMSVQGDEADCDLIVIDIGGAHILARITRTATRELSLRPGMKIWALVKATSLRRHAVAPTTSRAFPDA